MDDNVFESAREIGLEKYLENIKKLAKIKFHNSRYPAKKIEKIIYESIKNKKVVSINLGPNNVHEILDEIRSND